ncbi:aldo/keto reductase [Methylocapsa acidiphila]|uniref:aldo/keto reductase n=1 Tax=Methylocapsa acidiphila TaxID=133552 RepID=UPI0004000F0B|nr:aldo/keto reductase [Methylocapsa acidiphila]
MEKRKLGDSGLSVAPLALGGNVFGWTADEATSFSIIDAFVDRGLNLIDTADVYSIWVDGHQGGESEAIIGKWLQRGGDRDKILVATKVGMDMRSAGKGLSKSHIIQSAEASLRRLRTDRIDLYQAHVDDVWTPLEETLEAFASLVQAGKVRAIGASNYVESRLADALAVSKAKGYPRYACLQPHYNLANRALFEGGLQRLCISEGIGVIPYYALAAGFLTGKYRDMKDLEGKARGKTVAHYLDPRGFDILAALDSVAARHQATPTQIALAWLIAQPGVTAPIVSATNLAQFNEIAGATEIRLDAAALDRLNKVSA